MGRQIRILESVEDIQRSERLERLDPQHAAAMEDAATRIITTLPRMFRMLKHQARGTDGDGPVGDLGESHLWVLFALGAGSLVNRDLAHRYNVAEPSMTRIIDTLVDKGYVARRPDLEDRRRIYIEMTDSGKEIARYAHEQFRAKLAEFLQPLSDRQLWDIVVACGHIETLMPEGGYDFGAFCPARARTEDAGQ